MSRYINSNVSKRSDDMSFEDFRKAFPELAEPALKAECEAGRKDGHAKGYSEGFAAGKAAAAKEAPPPKPPPPKPEELEKIEAALPLDERAKRRWGRDPELRAEFRMSGFLGYLSTLKHEAKNAAKR